MRNCIIFEDTSNIYTFLSTLANFGGFGGFETIKTFKMAPFGNPDKIPTSCDVMYLYFEPQRKHIQAEYLPIYFSYRTGVSFPLG